MIDDLMEGWDVCRNEEDGRRLSEMEGLDAVIIMPKQV